MYVLVVLKAAEDSTSPQDMSTNISDSSQRRQMQNHFNVSQTRPGTKKSHHACILY